MNKISSHVFSKKSNRCISIFLFITLIMSLAFFAQPVSAEAAYNVPSGFERISGTQNIILYCNPQNGAIAIEDTRTGYVWKSIADESVYDINSANSQWKSSMTSMLEISYVDKNKESITQKANSNTHAKNVRVSNKNGELSLDYDFKEAGIIVTLEIKLENDSLIINVPAEKIQENGKNLLVNIDLMPFFGAAGSSENGYLLYPDGSGAITRYENSSLRPGNVKYHKWNIYGSDQVDLREYSLMNKDQKYQVMLPVYGIKNGDNAIITAVCNGEENAEIKLFPDGFGVNLNRIFFSFIYRRFYNINLSNITVNGINTAKTPVGTKIDKEIIKKDREVRIFFLEGKSANYSGMANRYREYLVNNDLLKNVINKNSEIPMGIDFFMGIKEERLLFGKFISMTTFKNAETISTELKKEGVGNMQVALKGWTKGGYGLYPINWPPERKLGGSSGLKAYSDYAAQNDIQLYLLSDFTQANSKNGGFSERNDVVMQGSNLPVTNKGKNLFLLNPFKALERLKDFFTKIYDIRSTGLAFENIGSIVYHDYSRAYPSGRDVTADRWEDMLGLPVNNNRSVAVEGGNQYVLKHADRLRNIPVASSGYYITDESVPFYQMVVHGSIPYTSEPANLSYDLLSHKLKWVEYGCMPYFELTYKKSINLKDTEYNRLFTSYYGDWYKKASEIYKEFNTRLGSVWSEKMTGHDMLGKNLYRVDYGNGTSIYINYNQNDVQYEGYKIKAQDYLVVEKGGIQK